MRLQVRPATRRTRLKISELSAGCARCHQLSGFPIKHSPCRHCAPPSSKSFESLDLVFHCVSGSCNFRIPLACATSLHSQQECRTFAAAMPGQSEPSPNREINVVRRLPRTLDLGAATDGYAHEQVPTELSGQAIFDIMERCHGKIGCAVKSVFNSSLY